MWRRRDGFTFLELAVVVLIMGIMVSVTFPRFSASFSRATLGATARRLAGTMAYIRNAAARDGRSYFLNIDLDKDEYWVTVINEESELSQIELQELDVLDDEIYTEVKDAFISRTRLQKRIAFERVILEDGTELFDGAVRVEFRPDGTAAETVIHLRNPKEKVYAIHLERYSGQATVYRYDFVPEPLPVLTERERSTGRRDAL